LPNLFVETSLPNQVLILVGNLQVYSTVKLRLLSRCKTRKETCAQ